MYFVIFFFFVKNASSLLFCWGTCLTLMIQILCFWSCDFGVRHMPPLSNISDFIMKLVLRGEAHVPHLSNKVLIFEFVLSGWGTCLTLLDVFEFFFKLVVGSETHASTLRNKIPCCWICILYFVNFP